MDLKLSHAFSSHPKMCACRNERTPSYRDDCSRSHTTARSSPNDRNPSRKSANCSNLPTSNSSRSKRSPVKGRMLEGNAGESLAFEQLPKQSVKSRNPIRISPSLSHFREKAFGTSCPIMEGGIVVSCNLRRGLRSLRISSIGVKFVVRCFLTEPTTALMPSHEVQLIIQQYQASSIVISSKPCLQLMQSRHRSSYLSTLAGRTA